ncbi:polysaccharide biosynthesis protein [Rhodanobacter thiooxydans]|uniref:Polysaccharide biosynthesis protein n=1 Tax=Rhodanobacter thiooxydans TaxID=416169 RepID=A0A154QLR8_9GAMM|nr:glycosyltransferase [Rhodanobacter thiooxydans]KZC24716.1 polysaccharide biosynthesis protein [Rhodanobacter thiooxydans]MCW0200428.1 glycosyltransferase [Rhodanobacter thiooxydans]
MKIVILTNAYPYLPGEQFIEDEIGYWAERGDLGVTLLPALAKGTPRPVPAGIAVDPCMARSTKPQRLWFVLQALRSAIFRRELGLLRRSRKMNPHTIARALLHVSKVLEQAAQLRRYARARGPIDVAYCYWNETQACAAVLARNAGAVRKVVSRVHGFDLYEARRRDGYMPLKRQFVASFDAIFTLSREARSYLQQTYGASPGNLRISPLGVPLAGALARPGTAGCLHVVSVSSCVRVKRLDKIVAAIALLARHRPDVSLSWTHIGGGPLLEEIKALAKTELAGLGNVACIFPGELPNHAVKAYYLSAPVDMLVNASESEGVPVSIMEAMSAGVPAIAPDVGGVASLVSDRCGALLSPCPDAREIAVAMEWVAFADGRDGRRAEARQVIETGFDAARNYRDFIVDVVAIGASEDGQAVQPPRRAAYRIRQATRQ